MAEKSGERVYNIPLRSAWIKQTNLQRTNRAVSQVRAFLLRHLHAERVKLSQPLNELLWRRGIKKPPSHVKVKVKIEDGVATARLPEEKEIENPKEKKPEGLKGKIEEKLKAKASEKTSTKEEAKMEDTQKVIRPKTSEKEKAKK